MTPTQEDHEAAAPERITAAAISQDGVIYTGPHHAAIIHYIARCAGIKPVTGEQGFITSKGRFARRTAALLIAIRAGQVDRSVAAPHGLLSEMLWSVPEDEWIAAALSEAVRVAVEKERERHTSMAEGDHFCRQCERLSAQTMIDSMRSDAQATPAPEPKA